MNNQVEKIIAEIERLDVDNTKKGIYEEISRDYEYGFANALTLLKNYIHALQEEPISKIKSQGTTSHDWLSPEDKMRMMYAITKQEPVSEDLESIVRQAMSFYVNDEQFGEEECVEIAVRNAVMKAANWQKQQMMKDAVDAVFTRFILRPFRLNTKYPNPKSLTIGDKVKLIIIK